MSMLRFLNQGFVAYSIIQFIFGLSYITILSLPFQLNDSSSSSSTSLVDFSRSANMVIVDYLGPFSTLNSHTAQPTTSIEIESASIFLFQFSSQSVKYSELGFRGITSRMSSSCSYCCFQNGPTELRLKMFDYMVKRQLLQMFCAVTSFHFSEFILAVMNHGRSNVTLESLLISKHYVLAMLFSLAEYIIELYFFPGFKSYWWVSNSGLVMVVVGEILRKLAIITAGKAFTHLIKRRREQHHSLVTHGVYKFVRHPGYTGFLIWSVGTQVMLCNPISTAVFSGVVWQFFSTRIPYEEYYLRNFFGSPYEEYAERAPSGIPFVK